MWSTSGHWLLHYEAFFALVFFFDCLVTFFKAAAPVCRTNALYKHLALPHFYLSQPVPGCSSTNYTRQSLNDLFYSHSLIYFSQTLHRLQRRSLTKLVFKFRNKNGSTHLACCSQPPIQMLDLSFLQKKTCAFFLSSTRFCLTGLNELGQHFL